jgi:penicillin amidase
MTASIDLMLSSSVDEALEVSKNHLSPVKNLIVIDNKNIAFKLIGKVPKRKPNHSTKGSFPSLGWNEANLWDGYYKYEENPKILNPSEGMILDTGNRKSTKTFPEHVTYDWPDTQKIQRLRTKMSYRDIYTVESLKEMQSDTISSTARSLLGLIAKDLWYEGELGPKGSTKITRQQILKRLSNWNGDNNDEMIEPTVFTAWMNLLQKRIIQDELGQLQVEFSHFRPLFLERVFKNINNAEQWCDVVQTTKLEKCTQLARDTLNDTISLLILKYGENISGLTRKNFYKAEHSHVPLGRHKMLKWHLTLSHIIPGAEFTLKGGKNTDFYNEELVIRHGSVYKGIYDFGDPDSSLYIISTGQSGHFLSRYYDDLLQTWKAGKYISMSLDPLAAKAGAIGITTIN